MRNGQPEESPKNAEAIGKYRLITVIDKQGREIYVQDKIIERIEEFYSELYDSDQSTIICN